MRKRLLIIPISLSSICLNAQANLDSLYAVWLDETRPDSIRSSACYHYIWDGFMFSDPDTAFLIARTLLSFSEAHQHENGKARAYYLMGVSQHLVADYSKALDCYVKSLKITEQIGDRKGSAGTLNNMGITYQHQGDYPKALEYYQRSLTILSELGDTKARASALANMANVYGDQGDNPKALEYYQRSLKVFEQIGYQKGSANIIHNIGGIYHDQKDYTKALEYYQRSLKIREEIGHELDIALALRSIGNVYQSKEDYPNARAIYAQSSRICEEIGDVKCSAENLGSSGDIYRKEGEYRKALDCYQRSLKIYEEIGEKVASTLSMAHIGNVYRALGDYATSLKYCKRSLTLTQEMGVLKEEEVSCECLYETYKAMGKGNEALVHLEKLIVIRDSLNTEETDKLLQQMEFDKQLLADSLQHVAELTQVENDRTIAEIRADKNRNRALATGGGALLLLAGGGAWFITDRKRRKERFEKEAATLETQALRSQMNPHFIFNALNSINAFVQQNDPDNATSFLTKFARVMRSVLENSRHSEVPLQDDLETLRSYMELERKRMGGAFDFNIAVDPAIDPEEVMVPPLVVQPFVENAIWHGMKGRTDKGHITLRVKQAGEQLLWQIEDDGAGRQPKQEPAPEATPDQPVKKTSLGTAITRSRLDLVQKQHGGKAGFHYEDLLKGTRVTVEMPLLRA